MVECDQYLSAQRIIIIIIFYIYITLKQRQYISIQLKIQWLNRNLPPPEGETTNSVKQS